MPRTWLNRLFSRRPRSRRLWKTTYQPRLESLEDRRVLSTAFALSSQNQLLAFDTATPGTILSTTAITGLQTGESLLGIDFRPATGQLYGLGNSNRLYTINPASGAAAQVGTGTFALTLSGAAFGFDFNPVPDRIRVLSDAEQNLRLHPDTGAVVDGDAAAAGIQPDPNLAPPGNVVAVAYTNNFAGTATTTLFGIDSASDSLVRIGGPDGTPSPNLGAVTTIGALNFDTSDQVGFDIRANDNIGFASLTVGGTPQLFTINLTTGQASLVGTIGTGSVVIRDVAVYSRSVTLFAIRNGLELIRFSSATPGAIASATPVTGLQTGETILGLDVRPATGQIYALGSTSRLYTIDPGSGAATQVGTAPFDVLLNGAAFGFDFNPRVDRIRVVSDAEQNLRLNPVDGTVVDADDTTPTIDPDTDLNPPGNVVAAAYTGNFAGTPATTLFGIDSASGQLVRIGGPDGTPTPNDGAVTAIGSLGVTVSDVLGFDIAATDGTAFAAMTVGGVAGLYALDLNTGAATLIGPIGTGADPIVGLTAASPGRVQFSAAGFTVAEGAGTATITVNRIGGTEGPVTVNFIATGLTAGAGADFTTTSGSIQFLEGETSKTFTIAIAEDTSSEGPETLSLTLSPVLSGASLGNPSTAVLTITDNDPPPTLSINSVSVTESNAGTVNAVFTLTLSAPAGQPVTVSVQTQNGTAIFPGDYIALLPTTVTFSPGQQTMTVTVLVIGDREIEADETFQVVLSNPSGATLGTSTGTGTIVDDDATLAPTPGSSTVQFGVAAFTVPENRGFATLTLLRTGDTSTQGAVTLDASGGTAVPNTDFVPFRTVVQFAPGQTIVDVQVPVADDAVVDLNKTVNLTLSQPTGGVILGSPVTATLTIIDDDAPPPPDPNQTPNQRFVSQAYRDLLGREADAAGLAFFAGALDAGTVSRFQVGFAMQQGVEFRLRVLDQLYAQYLRRAVDGFGRAGWLNFLASGGSISQVAVGLASSPEYFANRGGGTNTGFLNAVYQDALSRPIDDVGLSGGLGGLNTLNRAAVTQVILGSPESLALNTKNAYSRFLNRAADASGLNVVTSALQSGLSIENVFAFLIGSDEYFARFAS